MIGAAILGFGTVGSGVAELLGLNRAEIAESAGTEITLRRIVDLRTFPGSRYESLVTDDFTLVERDPDIAVVIETIGGCGVALDYTRRALAAGKSVVTSNKQLVAEHGPELVALARAHGVSYLFEASVGGGIPVLHPIRACLGANRVEEVYGILNGTTNYILTQMFKNGIAFEAALSQAQELGYAERNPAADIEGLDACRKMCILCALCFHRHMYPRWISTEGITGVTSEDVALASGEGYEIRLLGRAVRDADDRVAAYVAPHLIPAGSFLSGVKGVTNGIVVRGNAVGETAFCGPGAGKLPTASAVVADVIDIVRHPGGMEYHPWRDGDAAFVKDASALRSRWFVRALGDPAPELRRVGGVDGRDGYLSPKTDLAGIEALCRNLQVLSRFRILDI